MKQLSLRARLTVWYTLALLAVLSLFGAVVMWQQGRIGLRRVDREIDGISTTLGNVLRDEIEEMGDAARAATEARQTVTAPGRAIAILDERGTPLAEAWNGFALASPIPDARSGRQAWTAETASGAWRVHAQPIALGTRTFVVVVATPLADVFRERREVQEAMWIGIPIAVLLAAGGGLWLASVGLQPIARMAYRASQMPVSGIDDLGESDRTDELGQLAKAFNGLVARLRDAVETERQFMADASHELRTPISVIRSASQITLAREGRDEAEYREALAIVGSEARRVGRLVEDMLVLARADAGGYPLRPVSLYLDELVAECRRTLDVLAGERRITIRSSGPAEVSYYGDEDLLRRMLLNVVQNAVQHTPSGSAVSIEMIPNARTVSIHVTDRGPGIPEADRARIFDRFFQVDPARREHGTGLGLPIARWIAEAHGGSLMLNSSDETGSTFSVVLPIVDG